MIVFVTPFLVPWTDEEKSVLLKALKKYGAENIPAIAEELPFKTVADVKRIIQYYQSLAQRKVVVQRRHFNMDPSPIDKWVNVLQQFKGKRTIVNHVSRALKYIALYEKRAEDSDVNLR